MPNYTIRVYGIWINSDNEVLLSDERIKNIEFTKFPGGGMEEEEGPIDCLRREWLEELNTEIEVLSHFYTTDFYQASAFHEKTQIISIYYLVTPRTANLNLALEKTTSFTGQKEQEEHFRFVPIKDIKPEDVTYPIDQYVVKLLKENARL